MPDATLRGSCQAATHAVPRWFYFTCVLIGFALATGLSFAQDKPPSYEEHVVPILRNHCFKCHNPDKSKADLDLASYNGAMKGGGSGAAVVPGDPSGSKLFRAITHAEEPTMPPNAPKIPDPEIAVIRRWIEGGLIEKAGAKALAVVKAKVNLALGTVSKGKPDGPPALPEEWLLEPVIHTERAGVATALAASPWAPLVAVGGQKQVLLYHSDSLTLLGVLPFPEGQPERIQFSRNGKFLLVGGGRGGKSGHAVLCDVKTGKRITTVGDEYDTVLAADVSSDLSRVALGGPGKQVKVYATTDGALLHQMKKHTDWVLALEYSPDAVLLATGDRNGGLFVWEAFSGQEFYTLNGHTAAITAVSWRADSDLLLSGSEDGTLKLWEMREGKQVKSWPAHNGGVLWTSFTHDGRVVSCGRDNLVTIWDANGTKLRSVQITNDLPVRTLFSHDGARVFASSWQGRIGVWSAADGTIAGDITPNPPTLAQRMELAGNEVKSRAAAVAKSQEGIVAAEANATQIKSTMAAHERSSPAFQFLDSTRQSQAAQRKAATEAGKGLEKLKTVAAASAAQLAAAEAEAVKLQAALEKVEKFSEPYKLLARQIEAVGKKLPDLTVKIGEAEKALADKTAAITAAAAELTAKIMAAAQTRDKSVTEFAELTKQSDAANQAVTLARTVADQDKTRLAQQQAAVIQMMTSLTGAEAEATKIAQALTGTNLNAQETQDLTKRMEVATKQVADARMAHENGQKAVGELTAVAEKSVASFAATEAEAAKHKTPLETAQKSLQAAKETVAQLDASRLAAAEAGKKDTETLQGAVAQATATLAAAKAENVDLQARLEKTEKFSDAFKLATSNLESATKQVAAARGPADHDRKEVADLQTALEKIAASVATAEVEADKAMTTLAKSDSSYQNYQALEKQLAAANQKIADATAARAKTEAELTSAQGVVAQIKLAQAHAALLQGRESLASKQQEQEKFLAAVVAAEGENGKALKNLNETQTALAAQPVKIKALETELQNAKKISDEARTGLKQAGQAAAENPEDASIPALLKEKQDIFRATTNQVQVANTALASAQARSAELTQQMKAQTELAGNSTARLQAAKVAEAESTRQLAAEKERVEKLAAEYERLKPASPKVAASVAGN